MSHQVKLNMKAFIILSFLTFSINGKSQTEISDIFHPSPNVKEMNKYLDQPVNTSSGIPSIQIPIYTINVGNIVVPISLDYHAGGIKVDQEAL